MVRSAWAVFEDRWLEWQGIQVDVGGRSRERIARDRGEVARGLAHLDLDRCAGASQRPPHEEIEDLSAAVHRRRLQLYLEANSS